MKEGTNLAIKSIEKKRKIKERKKERKKEKTESLLRKEASDVEAIKDEEIRED